MCVAGLRRTAASFAPSARSLTAVLSLARSPPFLDSRIPLSTDQIDKRNQARFSARVLQSCSSTAASSISQQSDAFKAFSTAFSFCSLVFPGLRQTSAQEVDDE